MITMSFQELIEKEREQRRTYILDTAEELFRVAERLHGKTMVLNFSRVEYISSRALGVLVSLYKKLINRERKLALCGVNPQIQEMLRLVRLDHLFAAYEDEGKAIAAEKQEP